MSFLLVEGGRNQAVVKRAVEGKESTGMATEEKIGYLKSRLNQYSSWMNYPNLKNFRICVVLIIYARG
jgi:hypothetical protein